MLMMMDTILLKRDFWGFALQCYLDSGTGRVSELDFIKRKICQKDSKVLTLAYDDAQRK